VGEPAVVYHRVSAARRLARKEIIGMPAGDSKGSVKAHEGPIGLYVVAAELAFLLAPFVVIAFAYLYRGDLRNVLYTPYWSLAASILIGQALIRFIARLLQSNTHDPTISWERVTLIFSVLIVLGLIPSLVVLLLVLISTQPSAYLGIVQVILFVVGVCLYLAFGWTGQEMVSSPRSGEEFSVELDIASANVPISYKKASGE
jgi:uncharacterized protein with PQ loop repeat